ncbi:MAG: hypothetical protein ACETWR_12795 [Anaerolineae bacterium]
MWREAKARPLVYLVTSVMDLRATDRILHRFLKAYDTHMEEGKGEYH